MMPHFRIQSRMQHVVRCRSRSPSFWLRGFSIGYRSISVVVAIGVGCFVVVVTEFSARKALTAEEKTFLQRYEIIRSKLAHDDLVGAKAESSVLARSLRTRSGRAARVIVESDTLQMARRGFAVLSRRAVSIARHREGYVIMYCHGTTCCPKFCVSCPTPPFGDWVQIDRVVENPFAGANNIGCGLVRE